MAEAPWDVIIVGQGLAGTTLAWHLLEAGKRVMVIDPFEPVTSSKIAAGLITPITGQRLSLSWRYDEFMPVAESFYARIEKRTNKKFFQKRTGVRLFKSDMEQQSWSKRALHPDFKAHLVEPAPSPLLAPNAGDCSGGGFAMNCAQLDVAAYLEASRSVLPWKQMKLDWQSDVTFCSQDISVRGHLTHHLISCEGYAATLNTYFAKVPFVAAKGDILTVRFHRPMPAVCLHRGIWVAPTSEPQIFRVGSTYDRETLDQIPSASARAEIEGKLQEFISVPYTVVAHFAAVRPIIHESKPIIGMHPKHDRLGFFNGLGSKGSLLAPSFAKFFSDFLVHDTAIPEPFDLRKFF